MIYGSWNIRCNRQKFSTFWVIFCPFSPLTTWKIKILTLKKPPGYIIILHICTKNDKDMIYGSWDIKCDRHNFLSFQTIFCPFTPLWTQKIKIKKKKWKKYLKISFYKDKWQSYDVRFLRYGVQWKNVLSFWTIFCPFNSLTAQNIKILKKWKKHLDISYFT